MRTEIKSLAKQQIKGKIGTLFVISLVMAVISITASLVGSLIPFVGGIAATIFVSAPLSLGLIMVYLDVANNQNAELNTLFKGYNDIWNAFGVQFFTGLFTFLWSLLFIIPGIIKAYSYSMAIYILAENKGMSSLEAIKKSKQMMEGHKMELFVLELSFIGWLLLCGVTFGIAYIWVGPYMSTTVANFYNKIKPGDYTPTPAEHVPEIESVPDIALETAIEVEPEVESISEVETEPAEEATTEE